MKDKIKEILKEQVHYLDAYELVDGIIPSSINKIADKISALYDNPDLKKDIQKRINKQNKLLKSIRVYFFYRYYKVPMNKEIKYLKSLLKKL